MVFDDHSWLWGTKSGEALVKLHNLPKKHNVALFCCV
jgi:hypothetical protein